ncbi:MAG TPA: hypothetical protein VL523_13500 [Terriglobia bacterium]|nr:hypothetical protein [Terriglobia bacterium]
MPESGKMDSSRRAVLKKAGLGTGARTALPALADPANHRPVAAPGVRFFERLKDATIFAYYTSQNGPEQELQYGGDESPGACTHPEQQN